MGDTIDHCRDLSQDSCMSVQKLPEFIQSPKRFLESVFGIDLSILRPETMSIMWLERP